MPSSRSHSPAASAPEVLVPDTHSPAEIPEATPAVDSANSAIEVADVNSPAPRDRPRPALADSRWRPFLCCAGALGVGMALAPGLLKPPAATASKTGTAASEIALAVEDTVVVMPAMPPGAWLRGRVRLVAGETDALGRAATGGQVARHLVEAGARVERGDAVVEISSGAAQRVAPVSERRQNRAEQGQIAAADAQNALARKISTAQSRLVAAQERVARAQEQTAMARDVVRRLQKGQSVASSEIPADFRVAASADSPRSRRARRARRESARDESTRREGAGPNRATQIASRQAEAAREAAQESLRALQTARDSLADAQSAARVADDKRVSAARAVTGVEARFDAQKASGADVEAARAALKDAQIAVNSADQALIFAKTEVEKREKNAASAQGKADSSAEQAAKSLASSRLEAPADANANASADSGPSSDSATGLGGTSASATVTLDQAIRFAGVALDESRRASRDAERINEEIQGYNGQVARSNSRIEAATQNLAQAQQGVIDSTPRPRFAACYAPSSGIITWISRLAREVGAGDPVFGLARRQSAAARFEDKSGLWRAIKPGAVLNAYLVDAPADAPAPEARRVSKSSGGAPVATPTATPTTVAELGAGRAIQLKMTQVQTPATAGEAAKLTGTPLGTASGEGTLPEGAQILVSMPLPNQKAALSVPVEALVQRGKSAYVAVLVPLSKAEVGAQNNADAAALAPLPVIPTGDEKADGETSGEDEATDGATVSTTDGAAVSSVPAKAGEVFRLRWTRVETGRGDGMRLEIIGGLNAGARVVSQPEDLEAMGFAPPTAGAPTIFDTRIATPGADAASNPGTQTGASSAPAPEEVLVRLTDA